MRAGQKAPDPERLLRQIVDPETKIEVRCKSMDRLCELPWLGKPEQKYPVWLHRQIRFKLYSTDIEEINDVAADVHMKLWSDIVERRIKTFNELSVRNDLHPGELTNCFVNRVFWTIKGEITKHGRNVRKASRTATIAGAEAPQFEIDYCVMESTATECRSALEIVRRYIDSKDSIDMMEMYFEGHSYEAIGSKYGGSVASIKMRVHRILQQIRKHRELSDILRELL